MKHINNIMEKLRGEKMKLTIALLLLVTCSVDKAKIVCNNGQAVTNPAAIQLSVICPEF